MPMQRTSQSRVPVKSLAVLPVLTSRASYDDACALLERFDKEAGLEAAERAEKARNLGNHIDFCHWRQIERMIVLLSIDQCLGTVH